MMPGGTKEQMSFRADKEIAYFTRKRGFIRIAMSRGIPLVPGYIFGENQIFRATKWDPYIKFSKKVKQITGFVMPLVSPWPYPTNCRYIMGDLVDVGPPNANPTNEQVEEVYRRYVAELQRVYLLHNLRSLYFSTKFV